MSGAERAARSRARTRRWLVLAFAPLLLALAACSGQSGGDPGVASARQAESSGVQANPTSAAPLADANERSLQFTRCLRDQGIDVPDSQDQVMNYLRKLDPKERNAAVEKCRQYAPAGQHAELSEEQKAQRLDYVRCLRAQGADIQDPDPTTGRLQMDDQHRFLDPDEELAKAMQACSSKAPQRLRK